MWSSFFIIFLISGRDSQLRTGDPDSVYPMVWQESGSTFREAMKLSLPELSCDPIPEVTGKFTCLFYSLGHWEGLRKCPESFSLDAELIREGRFVRLPQTQLGTPLCGKSSNTLHTSLLSPALNQGVKPVPLEGVAFPPGDPARSRILLISQRVAIYGFRQNNRIAKLQTPRLLFFFPFSFHTELPVSMAMNRMFCTKKHFKCHWGKVRTPHSSLQSRKVKWDAKKSWEAEKLQRGGRRQEGAREASAGEEKENQGSGVAGESWVPQSLSHWQQSIPECSEIHVKTSQGPQGWGAVVRQSLPGSSWVARARIWEASLDKLIAKDPLKGDFLCKL